MGVLYLLVMALLNKLKSILGIGGAPAEEERRTETAVTVEHEADDEPTTDSADDDHATDDETETEAETESKEADTVASDTDAAASTGSLVETDGEDPETAAEPAEAAGAVGDEPAVDTTADEESPDDVEEADTDADDVEAEDVEHEDVEAEDDEETASTNPTAAAIDQAEPLSSATETDDNTATAEPDESGEPVETIKGIGPAYGERLEAAGISSVAELAAADPDEIADAIDVSAKIVSDWVERAENQ